VLPIE
jgi:hypothetical protein